MRSYAFFVRLPFAVVLAAAPIGLSPAFAQEEDEVVFAPGTGPTTAEVEYANGDYDDVDAQGYSEGDSSVDDVADRMSDPALQNGIASSVERAAAAMMNVPVGPLAKAIEGVRPGTVDRRVRRDTRLGDLAGRDAAYLPEELGARSHEVMGMMGGFARAMAAMMPEFKRMSREMEDSFQIARDEARR